MKRSERYIACNQSSAVLDSLVVITTPLYRRYEVTNVGKDDTLSIFTYSI